MQCEAEADAFQNRLGDTLETAAAGKCWQFLASSGPDMDVDARVVGSWPTPAGASKPYKMRTVYVP